MLRWVPKDAAFVVVSKRLGWPAKSLRTEEHEETAGPGNALVLRIEHAHVAEVFVAYGRVGVPAERVARSV